MDYRTADQLDSCMASIIVWDIETIPDLKGFAAANGLQGMSMTGSVPFWETNSPSTSDRDVADRNPRTK
jgi:hypothetical protein